jgi:hypothetical protein
MGIQIALVGQGCNNPFATTLAFDMGRHGGEP